MFKQLNTQIHFEARVTRFMTANYGYIFFFQQVLKTISHRPYVSTWERNGISRSVLLSLFRFRVS